LALKPATFISGFDLHQDITPQKRYSFNIMGGDAMHRRLAISTATALLLHALTTSATAAQLDRRLMGAWAQSEADCKQVFETRNGRATFRRPVNGFITAFIIRPKEIVATTGQCRVGGVTTKGDHLVASLSCKNSIGFAPVSARFKVVSENEIMYGSTDDPLLDSAYVRCQ
jgi:hypothetical protein